MEAIARAKYLHISPIKMRQILGLVRGKNVDEAMTILHYTPKRGAQFLYKALHSAVANFTNTDEGAKIAHSDIFIKNVRVDEGPVLRRFRPMSMGRVGRIRRRTSHLTIVLENRQ